MEISIIFKLLTYCGAWKPTSWTSRCKTAIYNVYSSFVVYISLSFALSQIINALTVNNIDDFVESTYISTAAFVGCCKITNMLICRKIIANLIGILLKRPCASVNAEETQIQTRYDKQIRNSAIQYTILVQTSVVTTVFDSLLTDFRNDRLAYGAWLPYNYSSAVTFQLTYVHQTLSIIILSFVHIACDILFCGLLMQICCQFDILECRLKNVNASKEISLKNYIHHHNHIYQLAAMINGTLSITIFSQFFGGFLILCLSLVQLLKQDILSTEFLATTCYLITMLTQSFLYCWYGNEVKLKSIDFADKIFQADWTELNEDAKRILLIAMNRTRDPIEFNSAHLMTVNMDFFVTLVKGSYSMYNVLQSSRK